MKNNPYRFYFILSLILFFVLLFFLPPAFAKSDSLGLFVSIVFFAVGVFALSVLLFTNDRPARLRHAPGSAAESGFRLYVELVS